MKATSNPITNKTALHLNRLIFGVHFLLSIAAMLVLIAHPCRAVRTHTHRYQVISTNCKTGVQRLKCRCGKKKKVHKKKGHRFRKAKDGYFTVSKCQNCGKIAKKYLNNDIPTYWNENVSIAIKTAKTHGNLPGYVFLTDPHWDRNAKNSPAIVSFVTKQMGYSYAVCGGDIITGCHDNKQSAVAEIEEFYSCFQVPVLSIVGNHDSNRNDNHNPDTYLSKGDINRLIYAHNPAGTHTSNGGDFAYIDDRVHRVRFITFHFDETSPVLPEVIDSIDQRVSELDDRWCVVLFSHAFWHYAKPGEETFPKADAKELSTKLLDIQAHSDATIVLWHVGHIHRDKHEVLSDGDGNHLLVVSTNCDAYGKSTCWGGKAMTKGTASEQVVDIVQIDKKKRTIYMTRIGAGTSRKFMFCRKTKV